MEICVSLQIGNSELSSELKALLPEVDWSPQTHTTLFYTGHICNVIIIIIITDSVDNVDNKVDDLTARHI